MNGAQRFLIKIVIFVFEFLNLLLHPFLERITHHTPVFMLLGLVCIAALLVPLHHRLEKWTTNKLVEKNKAIRLANAKKTIEHLEGEADGILGPATRQAIRAYQQQQEMIPDGFPHPSLFKSLGLSLENDEAATK